MANKPGGLNVRNSDDLESSPHKVSLRGRVGEDDPLSLLGKAADVGEETGKAPYNPTGSWLKHPGKDLQNNVGKKQFPAGARSNLQRPREISGRPRSPVEGTGLAHELVGAKKKG